jgi:nucleotide-binding universal stress UspA family protein
MNIRTILAAVSGGPATGGAIELGCRLARRFGAHLEGFHVLSDPRAVLAAGGEDIIVPPSAGLIAGAVQQSAVRAGRARRLFHQTVELHGIALSGAPAPGARRPSARWREETGLAAALVAERGRYFDLVVLGRSERVVGGPHTQTIEQALQQSGRPVLLAPVDPPPEIGTAVAIAWNGSPQAVRAMTASLPFLEQARAVTLITAGDDSAARAGSMRDVCKFLAWHGIVAEPRLVAGSSGRQTGRVLIETALEAGADLLVMGAYGQSPWREQLFGGATRAAVARMPLPLLLMH